MDEIPSGEQRIIDELVEFWQTRHQPRDLVTHINRLSSSWGSNRGVSFFRQVYEDLRTDKRSWYAVSSASEFQRFLEAEYRHPTQAYA